VVRAVGARLLWPFRRFFDPRFQGLEAVVAAKHEDLAARIAQVDVRFETIVAEVRELRTLLAASIDTTNESNIVVGRTLAELLAALEAIGEEAERSANLLQGNAPHLPAGKPRSSEKPSDPL
jgi:hypothetical protein